MAGGAVGAGSPGVAPGAGRAAAAAAAAAATGLASAAAARMGPACAPAAAAAATSGEDGLSAAYCIYSHCRCGYQVLHCIANPALFPPML